MPGRLGFIAGWLGLLLATLAAAGGCSKKIWITQIPEFYTPELKTIAVVPFRNQSTGKNAGQVLADKLATALMANGTYRVFNRNDLRALMDENDLRIAFGGDTSAATTKFRQATNVQAILTGTVTTYSATSNRQQKQEPVYAYDRNGRQYVAGYRRFVHTRNEANVSATAALIRVSNGTTIHATPSAAWARAWSEGSPPKKDAYACAADATDMVVGQLVEQFAPIRKQIKVDITKALRTATELYDNEWAFSKRFKTTDDRMYVVVALPASCDRNRFRLAIVRKGERKDLASQDITWTKKYSEFGYAFNPKQIAAAGGGAGEYEVKFYSGAEPVLRYTFRIE